MRGLASEIPLHATETATGGKVERGSIGRAVLFRFREMGKGWMIRSTLPGQMFARRENREISYGFRGQG